MPRSLPVDEIERNILLQFQASDEISNIILQLADIARGHDDHGVKKHLEVIMYTLLDVSRQLNKGAEETGRQFFHARGHRDESMEH